MQRNAALDTVVRFAGEEALCGLLRVPLGDDELAQLPGLVFRAADGSLRVGAPASIRAPGPLDVSLARGEDAPLHIGFGAADLIVSQGCAASCAYCCVAGATKLAGHEQRRARLPTAPYQRQPIASIADSMAALYHERRTRVLQHYRFADRRTELLGRVLTSMPTRLAERSVPIALYDLGYNLGIARRLLPAAELDRCVDAYARISVAWNQDQIRLLRLATEAASSASSDRADALIASERGRVTAHDHALLEACDAALAEVEANVSALGKRPARAHTRGKLLGAVALSMSLAGCTNARLSRNVTPEAGSVGGDAMPPSASARDAASDASARDAAGSDASSAPEAGLRDAGEIADASPVVADSSNTATPDAAGACTSKDMLPSARLESCPVPCATALRIHFDAQGKASGFSAADGGMLPEAVRACLQTFIGDYCYPSLAGMTHEFSSHCWIA